MPEPNKKEAARQKLQDAIESVKSRKCPTALKSGASQPPESFATLPSKSPEDTILKLKKELAAYGLQKIDKKVTEEVPRLIVLLTNELRKDSAASLFLINALRICDTVFLQIPLDQIDESVMVGIGLTADTQRAPHPFSKEIKQALSEKKEQRTFYRMEAKVGKPVQVEKISAKNFTLPLTYVIIPPSEADFLTELEEIGYWVISQKQRFSS